jgi:hypothetical protein
MKNYVMAVQNVSRDAAISGTGHFICRSDMIGALTAMNVQLHVHARQMPSPEYLLTLHICQKTENKRNKIKDCFASLAMTVQVIKSGIEPKTQNDKLETLK